MLTPCLVVAAMLAVADPEVVDIPSSRDATLYQSASGNVANGAGWYLFAGTTLREGSVRRALLSFDVASRVRPGAVIVAATLHLHVSRTLRDQPATVTIHPALASWSEGPSDAEGEEGAGAPAEPGDCTWLHRTSPGERWQTAGGDFGPSVTQTVVVNEGWYTWPTSTMFEELIGEWAAVPAANFGVIVRGGETSTGNTKRFASREHDDPSVRPFLRVTYRCVADFNEDGFVDQFDYGDYVACFEGDCAPDRDADVNGDGFVDFFDYERFVVAFERGC